MKRAVRAVIRLLAAGMIVIGGLEIGLELVRQRFKHEGISLWQCIIGAILILVGIILIWASEPLAKKWTDDFDE